MSLALLSFPCRISRHYTTYVAASASILHKCMSTSSTEPPVLPFSALPGPNGTLQTLLEYARGGGISNICETQRERFARYGPIFVEHFVNRHVVNISDAEAIAKILRAQTTFPMRPGFEAFEKCMDERGHTSGLASNNFDHWYKERSVLSNKFMRPKEVNLLFPGFNEVSKEVVERIRLYRGDRAVKNLENELFYWATESVCTLLFDERLGFYDHPPHPAAVTFVKAALQLNVALGNLLYGLPLYKYFTTPSYRLLQDSVDTIYTIGEDMVKATEVSKSKKKQRSIQSLFDVLSESGQFTSKAIVNILIGMMNAGVDTTTIVALWTIYLLGIYPDTQEKLYAELHSVLGPHGEISPKTVNQLPYLKACVKESMRLRPPTIITPRKLDHDINVLGYTIPADVDIMLYTLILSTSEKHYGNDAKHYVPERWMRGNHQPSGVVKDVYHAFTSMPFGYGVRMCIGRRIAEAELYSLLSQLVLNFRMEYIGESEPKQHVSALVKPDRPLHVTFTER